MTPKQILDSFSETLVRDDRILSAQERTLVSTLLQHAKAASGSNQETQEAVRAVVASAVGEVVAQRAFAVLGGSIVERILESSALVTDATADRSTEVLGPGDPQTPTRTPLRPSEPQTPTRAPLKSPGEPQTPTRAPLKSPGEPQTPTRAPLKSPGEPQTPTRGVVTTVVSEASIAIAERPQSLPARCVVLDEFLAPQELEELTRFTLAHENDFQVSEVLSPHAEGGVVNYDHRRSRLLMDLERHEDVMLERIKSVLPQVLKKLDMEEFEIAGVEAQITASNDGDFFRFHCDNASDVVASRHLTFVYFFHREPRQFEGGELRIHDSRLEDGHYVSQRSYQTIVPQQNQIVFFPCELMHEITAVKCPSQHFGDSRFTMNGWLRQ
jgi:SM-20-related protein